MIEVEQFKPTTSKKQQKASKGSSNTKDKDKEKHIPGLKKQQQEATKREAAAAKRMHDLMRQFGTILSLASCSLTVFFCSEILLCLDLVMDLFHLGEHTDILLDCPFVSVKALWYYYLMCNFFQSSEKIQMYQASS